MNLPDRHRRVLLVYLSTRVEDPLHSAHPSPEKQSTEDRASKEGMGSQDTIMGAWDSSMSGIGGRCALSCLHVDFEKCRGLATRYECAMADLALAPFN